MYCQKFHYKKKVILSNFHRRPCIIGHESPIAQAKIHKKPKTIYSYVSQ